MYELTLIFKCLRLVSKKGHGNGLNSVLLSALVFVDGGDSEELTSRLAMMQTVKLLLC